MHTVGSISCETRSKNLFVHQNVILKCPAGGRICNEVGLRTGKAASSTRTSSKSALQVDGFVTERAQGLQKPTRQLTIAFRINVCSFLSWRTAAAGYRRSILCRLKCKRPEFRAELLCPRRYRFQLYTECYRCRM